VKSCRFRVSTSIVGVAAVLIAAAVPAFLLWNLYEENRQSALLDAGRTDQLSRMSQTIGELLVLTDERREQLDYLVRSILDYAPRIESISRSVQAMRQELRVIDARFPVRDSAQTTSVSTDILSQSERKRLLNDARRLIGAGDRPQAERTLELLLERWPAEPSASLMLAQLTLSRNPEDPASLKRVALLAGSALSDPALAAGAHALLGEAARNRGDTATAETEYRRAVSLAPGITAYNRALAFILCGDNRWNDAVQQFELVMQSSNGGDEEVRYRHALALAKIGESQKAADAFATLAAESPNFSGAAEKAGEIFSALGEHAESARWYRKAAATRASWQLLQSSGREELAAGNEVAAVEVLERATRLLADSKTRSRVEEEGVLHDLLVAYSRAGDKPSAARVERRLRELQPEGEVEATTLR